jgi:hypothetical protein
MTVLCTSASEDPEIVLANLLASLWGRQNFLCVLVKHTTLCAMAWAITTLQVRAVTAAGSKPCSELQWLARGLGGPERLTLDFAFSRCYYVTLTP